MKVFVGLSGGVDSAVSAALLQHEGAEVVGVFIQGWYPPGMPCTWQEDRRDAMRVAAHLGIPFYTLDASAEYKKSVIDYLLAEYAAGRTPNPDVMCNREVKFGAFYKFAMEKGADFIATGHYLTGEKDQRYFLWAVPKEVLAKTLFPVGHMEKSGVRKLARKFKLPVAKKKDSQGVCFLGPISMKEFLMDELGIVQTRQPVATADSGVHFREANWLLDSTRVKSAQVRYHGPLTPGHISNNTFIPNGALAEDAVHGQSIVFYDGDVCVGGGIIE